MNHIFSLSFSTHFVDILEFKDAISYTLVMERTSNGRVLLKKYIIAYLLTSSFVFGGATLTEAVCTQ